MPIPPPPTRWVFPPVEGAEPEGPVALGGDLEPGTLLAAYRSGLFPMPLGRRGALGWFSPDPRGILPPEGVHVSRSLQRSMRHFELRIDTAFDQVIEGCADPARPHGWIDHRIKAAYIELHRLGWAHSIETWRDDQLVGGLYGVGIGAFFAGESMYHRATDASKAAVVGLARIMAGVPASVIDIQWCTPHLASLGVIEVDREHYLDLIATATERRGPAELDAR